MTPEDREKAIRAACDVLRPLPTFHGDTPFVAAEIVDAVLAALSPAEPAGEGLSAKAYCGRCGEYMPLTLDESRRVHECGRTPPLDGLPPTIYACPVCGGHAKSPYGCWGSAGHPHEHAFMQPIHKLVAALSEARTEGGESQ